MKKILHKLRVWLILKLGGVPKESYDAAVKAKTKHDKDIINRDRDLILSRMRVKALNAVIREICRRSETSYYDWCCDYCQSPVRCKHNGWCQLFIPRGAGEDGGINE